MSRAERVTIRTFTAIAAAVATAVTVAACGGDDPAPAAAPAAARVVRVVDGDTVILRIDGDDTRVRLLGVDAPESVTPDRPVECWGPQAAAAARRLMPKGADVTEIGRASWRGGG